MADKCQCGMYKREGTCYHTGYRPPLFKAEDQPPTIISPGHLTVYRRLASFMELVRTERPKNE